MAGPRKTTKSAKAPKTAKTPKSAKARTTAPRKAAAAKPAPPVKLVQPEAGTGSGPGITPGITVVTPPEPVVTERLVKKPELIDRVVEATGMKRKDVKPALEATLAEVGRIVAEGADMQFPELGKLMIHKRKDIPNGEMVMLKLRRKTAAKPLAKEDDNG